MGFCNILGKKVVKYHLAMKVEFLIGRGSRLPNIIRNLEQAGIEITLIVSHRKPNEGERDVIGIAEARRLGITAVYFNLVQMRALHKSIFGETDDAEYRKLFEQNLAEFMLQSYYRPDLVVMTGWNLVLGENFLRPFQKEGIPVWNVHPFPLPDVGEAQDEIVAPDGKKLPVLRGQEVWVETINRKLAWSGVTVHEAVPEDFDIGKVVAQEWLKVKPADTAETLREKLNVLEDKLVPQTILEFAQKQKK